MKSLGSTTLLMAAAATVLGATPAHAYLDPGTGSYLLQIMIASLVGAAFAVKMFWRRIGTFFNNLISRKSKDE